MTDRERIDAMIARAIDAMRMASSLYHEADDLMVDTQNCPPSDGTVDESKWNELRDCVGVLYRCNKVVNP